MKLTKDELEKILKGDYSIDKSQFIELSLKNQEDAEKWNDLQGYTAVEPQRMEAYLKSDEIVELLKKRIKELELETKFRHPNGTICLVALEELQKILGEEIR